MWSSDSMAAEVAHKETLCATCRHMWHTKRPILESDHQRLGLRGDR
jgi:hypothetical protein